MNQHTPSHKRSYQNINNIETPSGNNIAPFNNKLENNIGEKIKFKTISHLNQYNNVSDENLNQISQKLFDQQDREIFLNKTESNINDKKVEKINYKLKIKTSPNNYNNFSRNGKKDNRNVNMVNNKNLIIPKSPNNMDIFNNKYNNKNILMEENKIDTNQKKSEEESENLSALAEDLLSLSEENDVEKMRKGPINKNDFLGESREFFNINKKQDNKFIDKTTNFKNLGEIKMMPKLQTKLYSSPLDKLNIKIGNNLYHQKISNKKNYNNMNINLNQFQLDNIQNSHTQTQIQTTDSRTYQSNVKNHISSNSLQNNLNNSNNKNKNNISKDINNNIIKNKTLLNNPMKKSQVIKTNNYIYLRNNKDMFNKTAFNQYNKNDILDLKEENINLINNNNRSVGKKKISLNLNINSITNRNNKNNPNIVQINSMGNKKHQNSKNEYLGQKYLKMNYNNQVLYTKNNNLNFNNMNNVNNPNNSDSFQNINSMNNMSNLYKNNNQHTNNINNNNKIFDDKQILKKTQTFNLIDQNNNKQNYNIEYIHKNNNNLNLNKNTVLYKNINNIYSDLNNYDFISKVQNNINNFHSNKLLRKSDYHKSSNKNIIYNIEDLNKDLIGKNYIQKGANDRASLLVKGKNKNSYKNIYNYKNVNDIKKNNKNIHITERDIISNQKKIDNFNSINFSNTFKNGNLYTYQGENEDFYNYNSYYLNNKVELQAF